MRKPPNNRWVSKLSSKIVICISGIMVILFFLFGSFTGETLEQSIIRNTEQTMKDIVVHEAGEIDQYFNHIESIAANTATTVAQWVADDTFAMSDEMFDAHYTRINGALRTNVDKFGSDDLSAVFLSAHQPLTPDIRRQIVNTEGRFGIYAKAISDHVFNTYLITPDNLLRIYPPDFALKVESQFHFLTEAFYAIGTPENNPDRVPQWTEGYYDDVWQEWMLSVNVPVYDGDEFLGIIGHDLLLKTIQQQLSSEIPYEGGYVLMFDAMHNVLIHPETDTRLLTAASMGDQWDLSVEDLPYLIDPIKTSLEQSNGKPVFLSFIRNGEPYFFCATPLEFEDLCMAVVVPQASVFGILPSLQRNTIYGMMAILVLMTGLLILVLWYLVIRPVNAMNHAFQSVVAGDYSTRLPARSHDEFGEAAHAFNHMTQVLQEDIRHREQIETELLASREEYRSLLNNLPVGVYRFSSGLNARIIHCNDAFLEMFGYDSQEQFNEKGVLQLHPNPEQREQLLAALEEQGTVTDYELYLQKKDGTPIFVTINSYVVRNEDGTIDHVDGVCKDITAQREVEHELLASREEYRSLLNNLPVGVYRLSPPQERKVITCNPAFLRIFGFDSIEELNTTGMLSLYVDPDDQRELVNTLEEHGHMRDQELRVRRKDGEIRHILLNAHTITNIAGDILFVDGICMDITEQREAEGALQASRELYYSLVNTIPLCLIRKDLEGRYTFVNQQMADLLQTHVDDLIGETDERFAKPDDVAKIRKADRRVIETREELLLNRTLTLRNGEERFFQTIRSPLLDEEGNCTGVQILF